MSFKQAVISGLFYYATFTGRASRSAYWYFVLFCFLFSVLMALLDFIFFQYKTIAPDGSEVVTASQRFVLIQGIALFIPNLAVTVRRLHDTDHSGLWAIINMAVYLLYSFTQNQIILLFGLGSFAMLFFLCQPGTNGDNRYGSNPLA